MQVVCGFVLINSVLLNLLYVWSNRTRQEKETKKKKRRKKKEEEEERLETGKGNQLTALRFQTREG